jgi:hypothetical protein
VSETQYDGQHDDCIATVPHLHARPYRAGDWSGATEVRGLDVEVLASAIANVEWVRGEKVRMPRRWFDRYARNIAIEYAALLRVDDLLARADAPSEKGARG